MSILRVYDPPECDERGVPLDWECCRACKRSDCGYDGHDGCEFGERCVCTPGTVEAFTAAPCATCGDHGSLKAAALAELLALRERGQV